MSERLRSFLLAMTEAEKSDNNYAAIALALTLPDICGSIDQPGPGKSRERYIGWWDTYAADFFGAPSPEWDDPPLITGQDAWALRNAFLHAGQDRLTGPGLARRVRFIHSKIDSMGCDGAGGTIYLAVDLFVAAIEDAVGAWLKDRATNEEAQTRLGDLLEIISPDEFYDVIIDQIAID